MADLNHIVLVGRLTRDAELKYTGGGQAICKFSLAVGRRRKQGDQWVDETSFFEIALWGSSGAALAQYLVKGKQVGVDGELRQERWEQDGQNRSRVYIVANMVQLLGGGQDGHRGAQTNDGRESHQETAGRGSASSQRSQWPSGAVRSGATTTNHTEEADYGFTDDIPF